MKASSHTSDVKMQRSAPTAATPPVGGSRRGRLASPGRSESGQALVEFVLVLPLVLLILFGIAQFAIATNSANDETHVANLVARYATVDENPSTGGQTLQTWGRETLEGTSAKKAEAKVCISFPSGEAIGDPVKVEVTRTVTWFPILKLKHFTTSEVVGTAYMRLEAPPTAAIYKAGCA